jgi:hypothetical protein
LPRRYIEDQAIAFRIPVDLKRKLQDVAKQEARSISQTCEIFLRIGLEGHEEEGAKSLQHFLSSQEEEPPGSSGSAESQFRH